MNTKSTSFPYKQSESGQSVLVVSVGLAAALLLVTGLVMASMAFLTSYAMNDPEKSGVITEWVDTTDGFSHAMEDAFVSPTAAPSLGAIVGNQVYLVDMEDVNANAEPASQ